MLKTDFPTLINTEAIISPIKWTETYKNVETVNTSEAGTDIVNITRIGKLSVTAQYKCTDVWAQKFIGYSRQHTLTVKIYDTLTAAYKEYTMRMKGFKQELVKKSDRLAATNGVWKIEFTLEEI